MSGAGASTAAVSAVSPVTASTAAAAEAAQSVRFSNGLSSCEYVASPEIIAILQTDKWLDDRLNNYKNKHKEQHTRLLELREEVKTLKNATKMAPLFMNELKDVASVDAMKDMMESNKVVEQMGGIEEINKMKRELDDDENKNAHTRKMQAVSEKRSSRAAITQKYIQTLKKHGLQKNYIYMVEWSGLLDQRTKEPLLEAYSFAMVLGFCEAQEKNADADPTKIHLRLTFYSYECVSEIYVEWDDSPSFMTLVTTSNVSALFDTVFSDKNVGVLFAADGDEKFGFETFKEKLKQDTLLYIKSATPEIFAIANFKMTAIGKRRLASVPRSFKEN